MSPVFHFPYGSALSRQKPHEKADVQVSEQPLMSPNHEAPYQDQRRHSVVPRQKQADKKFYKPVILRTVSLCILFCISLGLVALIEYSLRILPHHSLTPGAKYGDTSQKRELIPHVHLRSKRDLPSSPPASSAVSTPASPSSLQSLSASATQRTFPTLDLSKVGGHHGILPYLKPPIDLLGDKRPEHLIVPYPGDVGVGVNSTVRIGGEDSVDRQQSDGTVVVAGTGAKAGETTRKGGQGQQKGGDSGQTGGGESKTPAGGSSPPSSGGSSDGGSASQGGGHVAGGVKASANGGGGGGGGNGGGRFGGVGGGNGNGGGQGRPGSPGGQAQADHNPTGGGPTGHSGSQGGGWSSSDNSPGSMRGGAGPVWIGSDDKVSHGSGGGGSQGHSGGHGGGGGAVGHHHAAGGPGDLDGSDIEITGDNPNGQGGDAGHDSEEKSLPFVFGAGSGPHRPDQDGTTYDGPGYVHYRLMSDGSIRIDSGHDADGSASSAPGSQGGVEGSPTQDGEPYTTTIDGQEVVVTPFASAGTRTGIGEPFTTTIDGKEVVFTPFPSGSTPTNEGEPFTTTIDGHEVVITPFPSSGTLTDDELPYTTTIDGKEVVITPLPSESVQSIKKLGSGEYEVVASMEGQGQLTTFTLPADPAAATSTASEDPRQGSKDDSTTPNWKKLTYEQSNKPLTFIKSPANYFYSTYFPVLLSVIFSILLGYLYAATKMMEPFAMLSKKEGALTKDFLWIDYLSPNDTLEPFTALASGHWLMLWVSVLYVAAQILSPLSSEMFGLYPSYNEIGGGNIRFGAAVWVHPQLARLMQAILILISFFILGTWFMLLKYPSQVYSDPSGIAGVAALTAHPDTARIFRDVDQMASRKDILAQLANVRWRLGWYQTEQGSREECYGIIPDMSLQPMTSKKDLAEYFAPRHPSPPPAQQHLLQPSNRESSATDSTNLLKNPSYRSSLRTQLILNIFFFGLLGALFGIILAYQLNTSNNSFERFMDADSFGPRFLLTTMGMLVKGQWSRLERREVVIAPFAQLSRKVRVNSTRRSLYGKLFNRVAQEDGHNADVDNDAHEHNRVVLAGRTLIPATTFITSIFNNRNFKAALLSFTALTAEALVIVVPGVPYSAAQKYQAMAIARYLCLSVLSFMLVVLVLYWAFKLLQWKSKVKMRREGNTVGVMVSYLAGTDLSHSLVKRRQVEYGNTAGDVQVDSTIQMKRRLGFVQTTDSGRTRWEVDFEREHIASGEV